MARKLPPVRLAAPCAGKLKVLGDPTRLAVIEALMVAPRHVGALAELLRVEQSLLSHHLQSLREANLVESERDGKSVLYRLSASVARGEGSAIDLGCCQISFE